MRRKCLPNLETILRNDNDYDRINIGTREPVK